MLGLLSVAICTLALELVYTDFTVVYTFHMTKRLVDIDEEALDAARSQLGTTTIKATVNEALRLDSARPAYFALLANIHLGESQWREALAAAERGLELEGRAATVDDISRLTADFIASAR